MAKKQKAPEAPPYPKVIETFREPGYSISGLRQEEPSCFNGIISVRRYRVTVEEIQEPDEVIAARILKLMAENNNHHHTYPLQIALKKYERTDAAEPRSEQGEKK